MIQLTQDEVNAFNIVSAKAKELQVLLQQTLAARQAIINLLEKNYDAVFDSKTGQFNEKAKDS